ncbi:hypothetical protein LP316_06780 [Thalassotalea sp. LPB0316]|uniref:hypothetical protein n=1 Tax=Thalassotalea sp. LPB0316 TaxID=2769490 RepID=UPI0018668D97|nr:hypothetical protein [Thalassotalea sp. LPB0316]QOL26989.1 hypothetical protein LP316_06780 [Thalassotalea sp. LPB0316]
MIRLFFLIPIIMCAIWWWYLRSKGFQAKDGIKGFAYIIAFNAIIIAFFILMIWVTDYP